MAWFTAENDPASSSQAQSSLILAELLGHRLESPDLNVDLNDRPSWSRSSEKVGGVGDAYDSQAVRT